MSKVAKNIKSLYKKYIAGSPAQLLSMKKWIKQVDPTVLDKKDIDAWIKGKEESQKGPKPHAPYVKKKSK
jgi:hypothetical protein